MTIAPLDPKNFSTADALLEHVKAKCGELEQWARDALAKVTEHTHAQPIGALLGVLEHTAKQVESLGGGRVLVALEQPVVTYLQGLEARLFARFAPPPVVPEHGVLVDDKAAFLKSIPPGAEIATASSALELELDAKLGTPPFTPAPVEQAPLIGDVAPAEKVPSVPPATMAPTSAELEDALDAELEQAPATNADAKSEPTEPPPSTSPDPKVEADPPPSVT